MKESARASAPGKVILFGEHFVVSGFPAIVTAIDRRVKVLLTRSPNDKFVIISGQSFSAWSMTGEVLGNRPSPFQPFYNMVKTFCDDFGLKCVGRAEVESEITGAAGLGSSAAVAVALVKAFSQLNGLELTRDEVIHYAMKAEKEFHGRPSGIDPTIATVGGTIVYHGPGKYHQLPLPANIRLVIVFSGRKRKTSKMVNYVQQTAKEKPSFFEELSKVYSVIYQEAVDALQSKEIKKLGHLFTLNHILLRCLGLSNDVLEKIVDDFSRLGACGSKLTGAGGGGCVIAAADKEIERLSSEMARLYPYVWLSQTNCRGVGE